MMLSENRIFKYKFIYFYSIIFLIGYFFYYAYYIGSILFNNYILNKDLQSVKIPVYFLVFFTFIFIILSLTYIFKESYKAILYFNIFIGSLLVNFLIFIFITKLYEIHYFIPTLIFYILFFGLPLFLVNYYKYVPVKSEINEIGKKEN